MNNDGPHALLDSLRPGNRESGSSDRRQARLEGKTLSSTEILEGDLQPDAAEAVTGHEGHDHEGHDHEGHNHEDHVHGPVLNPDCTRELVLDIPAEEVTKAYKSVAGNYRKYAKIPGFRAGKVPETERQMFSLREGDNQNPYSWDFDLCSLTLGNFNYRKMTLVRDYAKLIETDMGSGAFDTVFSLKPKPAEESPPPLELGDQHLIIACDATQASAVARARTGASYIIQGPPGTGKSSSRAEART